MITATYILGGLAEFAILTPNGGRFDFQVERVERTIKFPETWFVHVVTSYGPTYLGKLDDFTGQVSLTAKSDQQGVPPAWRDRTIRILNHVLVRIWCDDHDAYKRHGYKVLCRGEVDCPKCDPAGAVGLCQRPKDCLGARSLADLAHNEPVYYEELVRDWDEEFHPEWGGEHAQ